eukprot:7912802-Ditylum_brightwellii.AAC.1
MPTITSSWVGIPKKKEIVNDLIGRNYPYYFAVGSTEFHVAQSFHAGVIFTMFCYTADHWTLEQYGTSF